MFQSIWRFFRRLNLPNISVNTPGGKRFWDSDYYRIERDTFARYREQQMIRYLDEFYWKCFFALRMNRVDGDYLEFGCGSNVRSFRLAYKYKTLERMPLRLFAFDSFEGLPEPTGIDRHEQWQKAAMAVSIEQFRAVLASQDAGPSDFHPVEGLYEQTLRGHSPADYGIEKAAFVMIDCDLYASASLALQFVADVLTDGSILAFDDWFCFCGDPERGEQRAFSEFLRTHPELSVSEYLQFGWHGKSFIVHRRKDDPATVINMTALH